METFGTGRADDHEIARRIEANFDFRLGGIIREFDLRHLPTKLNGGFRALAVYGQVGRVDLPVPWEAVDRVDALR